MAERQAPMEPIPSATVVVLRDGGDGLETLLLQRSPHKGKPSPWVFPGGRVEEADLVAGSAHSVETARIAALRETLEESALVIEETALQLISRWVTPPDAPRRFDTWFFIAAHDEGQRVEVDGEEMIGHRWMTPQAAVDAPEVGLAPPQFVTLTWLLAYATMADALGDFAAKDLVTFRPKICRTPGVGYSMLYSGDAGYDTGDPEVPGARHRCYADTGKPLRYERIAG
jgi:8-oxo-dGTP pyrophosphatase MutT (NUDIX family)